MLDANLKKQLDTYLQNIVNPIELSVSLDEHPKSQELKALAEEIASMSSKISLKEGSAARTPQLSIAPQGQDARTRFAGIPMGHEFTSLVLALLQNGGHPSKADPELLEQIRQLPGEYHFETYISLSCQNCPDVVQALNLMAVLNPRITHVMIDGALFQQEVEERKIMAVPTVYLNGELFGQGRMTLAEIVNKLDSGAAERQAAALNEKAPYEVLVIGGGPAGSAAAVYTARKGVRTGVVAERFGGQVMDTVGIENFISVTHTEGAKLAANLEQHVKSYDVDVITEQKAVNITKKDSMIEVELASGATLKSRSVILSTGARWREMNVPGEQQYRGKGVAYCPHCDGPLFKGKKVAVIGGGNSGIEAAIDLAGIVQHVTVLEFSDVLRADEVLVRKAQSLPNVTIIKQAQTTEVIGDGDKVTGLKYLDRTSNESHLLELAGIFVQIGLVPNTEWLKGSLDLTERGEIIIDARGQTSMEGVFAAGDATTVPYKQIIISMGAGATAALSAFDYLIRN